MPPAWGFFVLGITSALLFRAALVDLREYKIRNGMILALIALFALHLIMTGRWADLQWDLPFAAVMFALVLALYGLGWMGGGDVKMLGVAFLWAGLSDAMPFAILLSLFCGVHGLAAKFNWVKGQESASGRRRIPLAPSVAAALICIFVLRSVQLTG